MDDEVTLDQEITAVQNALCSMDIFIPYTELIKWDRARRAEAVEWCLHNAAAVRTGEGEILEPLEFLLPYLTDGDDAKPDLQSETQ